MRSPLSVLGCLLLLCAFALFAMSASPAASPENDTQVVASLNGVEVVGLPGIVDDLQFRDKPLPRQRKRLPNAPQGTEEPPLLKPVAEKSNIITCDELIAKRVTVRSGDGKYSVTICAWETGVGMFTSAKDSRECVTIVHQKGQSPYIGLHDGGSSGCPIAITMEQGLPQIQVVANETYKLPDGTLGVRRTPHWITTNALLNLTVK